MEESIPKILVKCLPQPGELQFNYWYSDCLYISILQYNFCRYQTQSQTASRHHDQQQHRDRLWCIYALEEQFFRSNGVRCYDPQNLKEFIKRNLKSFSFQYPDKIFFQRNQIYYKNLKSIERYEFCPADLLYQAIGAAKIIRFIKNDRQLDILKEFQRLWKNDLNRIPEIRRGPLQRSTSVLKGMFSFQQTLNNNESRYHLNQYVFADNRLTQGLIQQSGQKWMVYHPTSITQQIFCKADYRQILEASKKGENIYIHGQGGLGKSTSFSLLVALHNIIQDFLFNYFPSLNMSQYEQQQAIQLQKFPKYFYFNLPQGGTSTKQFLEILIKQSTFSIKMKAFRGQFQTISHFFKYYQNQKQINIKPILIIDQINTLFYMLRRIKYQNDHGCKEIFLTFQKLFSALPLQQFIIYGSSENAQLSLLERVSNRLTQRRLNFSKRKINHLFKRPELSVAKQIVSIIQFQNLNQVAIKNTHFEPRPIMAKRNQYKNIKEAISFPYYKWISLYLQDFTHESVKNYFREHEKDLLQPLQKDNNIQPFIELIQRMHHFMVKRFSKTYQKFIFEKEQDQEKLFVKYYLLTRIRMAAYKFEQQAQNQQIFQGAVNQKNLFFQFNIPQHLKQFQFEILFKEYAEIVEHKLTIFISPSSFIEATRFLEQKENFIYKIAKQFVLDYRDQPDWFGKTVETTFINLMHGQVITLINGRNEWNIGEPSIPPFKFGHFMRMVTQQQKRDNSQIYNSQVTRANNVYSRFDQLWDQMDQYQIKLDKYICAKPCPMHDGQYTIDGVSSNSQAIDLLLIKKCKQQYNNGVIYQHYDLITLDFCMAFQEGYVRNKFNKASLFVRKFMHIAKLQSLWKPDQKLIGNRYFQKKRFINKLTHFIVLPRVMSERVRLNSIQEQKFQIKFTPVEDLKVRHYVQSRQIDMRQRILQALLNVARQQKSLNL